MRVYVCDTVRVCVLRVTQYVCVCVECVYGTECVQYSTRTHLSNVVQC